MLYCGWMYSHVKSNLYDIVQATQAIAQFLDGKTIENYTANQMLKSAVERQFIIICVAMGRVTKSDPALAASFNGHLRIIDFYNVHADEFNFPNDTITWNIVQNKLPRLVYEVETILKN
jgi:uncharacterized protein with HEPN domain